MERKIALIIVEGSSDSKALQLCLNNFLIHIKKDIQIDCKVYGTDICLHEPDEPDIVSFKPENMIERIKQSVRTYLESQSKSTRINQEDIALIAVLSDLDACYCTNILFDKNYKVFYDLEKQAILTDNPSFICQRNFYKIEAYDEMRSYNQICIDFNEKKTKYPFKVFYQSINLEHITANNPNIDDEDLKQEYARKFRSTYSSMPILYHNLLLSLSKIGNSYEESWNRIELHKHCFERMTNIKFLIDWIIEVDRDSN